jgi:hypothetical protein
LAGELAKFDSGHALIARLIGEELARNNCSAREIEELISKAKGKAEAFIILHINGLFKVHKKPKTAKALVEIFALRRPFINSVGPGGPILTPGIIELIGEKKGASLLQSAEGGELRNWLALRQHDLIEEAIKKLLKCIVSGGEECKELGDALDPWETPGVMESLREVSEKVRDESTAVEYFVVNYGKKLTNTLKVFSNECWKRAALIIGHALTWRPIVSRHEDLSVFLPEDLRKSFVEPLSDALERCGVDYYLLVGNVIPPLIRYLTKHHAYALAEAFVDKYDKAVAEIKRVLYIASKRGRIYDAEGFYGLGLASIIAKAVEPGKPIEPGDADAALHIVLLTMQHTTLSLLLSLPTNLIKPVLKPVLSALVPLRDKAPKRYLEVLASALDKVSRPDILGYLRPDLDAVMYILNEFDYILNKYGDGVKGRAWTLVLAIDASINSLYRYLELCDDYSNYWDYWNASLRTELEHIARRVAGLLNEVDRLNPSLGIIAWAHALLPALENKCVRALMESVLGVDVVNKKAKEIAEGLSGLSETVQELIRDEDYMDLILKETSDIMYEWALYKLDNDELYEAEELFNKAARERWEIGDYERYLDYSNWALRAKAIRSKLAGDKLVELVNGFRQLYEEAKKQSDTGALSTILSNILGGYLVSLALTSDNEGIKRIEELLGEEWLGHEGYSRSLILTRLTLNALLSPRGELSGELKDRLFVKPGEFIVALGWGYIDFDSLPALRAIYGTIKPGDEKRLCDEVINKLIILGLSLTYAYDFCMRLASSFLRIYSEELSQQEVGNLRQKLISYFQRWISNREVLDLLKKLDLDAESLKIELRGLIHELSGKSLLSVASFSHCVKHKQRDCSSAHLAYMLYALINGNEKLAKAHALYGAASAAGKLPARLFLEAYKECRERCDLKNESFRLALARLFFYHYSV